MHVSSLSSRCDAKSSDHDLLRTVQELCLAQRQTEARILLEGSVPSYPPLLALLRILQAGAADIVLPQWRTDIVLLAESGMAALAASLLESCLRQHPEHAESWKLLGVMQERCAQPALARESLLKAVDLAPQDDESLYILANLSAQTGPAGFAEQCYIQVLGLNATHIGALNNLGNLLKQQQRWNEAEQCFRQALQLQPGMAILHHNLANVLLECGRIDQAMASSRQALTLQPDYVDAHICIGLLYRRLGDNGLAEQHFRLVLQLAPEHVLAKANLAVLLLDTGQLAEAEGLFEQTIAQCPDHAPLLSYQGDVLMRLGKLAQAEEILRKAVQLQADNAHAWNNLGLLLARCGRADEARQCYLRAIELEAGQPQPLNNLGVLLSDQGYPEQALACYEQALQLQPDYAEVYSNMANALHAQGRLEAAVAKLHHALVLRPDYAEAHNNLANVLLEDAQLEEAEQHYRQAVGLRADYAEACSNLGSLLIDLGNMDEGRRYLRQAAALEPGNAAVLASCLQLLPDQLDAPAYQQLPAVYAQRGQWPLSVRSRLCFGMGKQRESAREYPEAFQAYAEGNALMWQHLRWDDAAEMQRHEQSLQLYPAALLQEYAALQSRLPLDDARIPVFIVGMPRSGSSLLEQILASHPDLYGAGELPYMNGIIEQAEAIVQQGPPSLERLQLLRQLGQHYLQQVWPQRGSYTHLTDKLPGNYRHLGLISLMLPQARMVHSMRDALDCCLSCYTILFRRGHEYCYEQQALGRQYLRYWRLMQHWQAVLPAGRLLNVQYEELVADLETRSRQLLQHAGLAWDPACLDFYRSDRTVSTASVLQVRQPLYASSIGRWKKYADELLPLRAILAAGQITGESA